MASQFVRRATALTVLSLTASGAVLAARPGSHEVLASDQHVAHATERDSNRQAIAPAQSNKPKRIKLKFQDEYRARLLPNGTLLSLNGLDVSSTNRAIEAFGLRLTPAVSVPDTKVDRIRYSIANRSDQPVADIAATFWADGTPRALDAARKHLTSDQAIEYASIVEVHQLPEAVLDYNKKRPRPTTDATPVDPPAQSEDYWSIDSEAHRERVRWYENYAERLEQGALPTPKDVDIASALLQEERFRDSTDRAHEIARRHNREFMNRNNVRGADLVICCIFQLVDPDGTFPSGDEIWRKSCLGDEGQTTADICDTLNNDETSISVIQGVYGIQNCGTDCLDSTIMAYGACCIPGTRGGEDNFIVECIDGDGDFQGAIPGTSLNFYAYFNCEACPLITGTCCINAITETPSDPGGWVWDGTLAVWDKTFCPGPNPIFLQPDVEPELMRPGFGYWNNLSAAQIATMDRDPSAPLWQWQDFDTPPAMMNPPMIVNARASSNSDEATACQRCLEAGGYWVPEGLPNIRFGGSIFCGIDPGIIDCDTGQRDATEILGGCSTFGAYVVTTQTACADSCTGGNANDQHGRSCWQANMANPSFIGAEGHSVHGGNWRPLWIQWFTPPPVLAEPDPAEWLVPFWEYAGTYSDWTGWDPELWWDEGFQPNLAVIGTPATGLDQFRMIMGMRPQNNNNATWFDAFSIRSQMIPAPFPEDIDPNFVPNYMVPNYGPCIRHGYPPTGLEYYGAYGLPQQVGDPLAWGDWPIIPTADPYVFAFQCIGSAADSAPPPDQMYPWDFGRNRWTDDSKFFRIGTPPSNDDTAFGRINNRYLQLTTTGTTIWNYYGDGNAPHPGDLVPPHDWSYGYPYELGDPVDPLRGSCYFPHSAEYPSVPLTNTLAGTQAVYTGAGCNDAACCAAVEAILPGCCPDGIGIGQGTSWDPLCVQVALDLVVDGQGSGLFFDTRTCTGVTPYLVPIYASVSPANDDLEPGEYNPDPRNVQLNPYLDATLPAYVRPALANNATCEVADTTAQNRFHPLARNNDLSNPIDPPLPPIITFPATAPTQEWLDYEEIRDRSGRLYQFMPRCAGIFSSAGQCNVAGNYSGRSAWAAIADDESTLIGCQDYDCCMRVISTLLEDKDAAADGNLYTDLEWVNWGHMGYPPGMGDIPEALPPLSGQWTPHMASRARDICYPNVVEQDDPDFFNLQLHMNRQALNQSFDDRWIAGPDQTPVQDDSLIRDLVWAPFSWSDNSQWDYSADPSCIAPHQNIYGLLPGPYYSGDGLALYPWDQDPTGSGVDPWESAATASQYLADTLGGQVGAFGRGVTVAVLGETAWLQERDVNGTTIGAVHRDLGNVVLESGVDMPLEGPLAETQAARCTAVLGVIAATDNGFGVTGMAHQATTMFFPTESTTGNRLEDAFMGALDTLQAGDVLLLAWQAISADGLVLNDPGVLTLVQLARAAGITVIVPAGDRQQAVGITTEDAGIIIVGGVAPAAEDDYIRWWSSNYGTDTTGFTPGTVNISAWGGGVTTTGGNANLTLLAVPASHTEDALTREVTLTLNGRQQSYTNDFGSRLDGSVAAAAQITGVAAATQGVCQQLYGESLLAADLHARMYGTATFYNGSDAGGLGPGFPTGYGGSGSPGAPYTWDLSTVDDAPANMGRMPQLGNLVRGLITDIPEDFAEGEWGRIIALDIITGELQDGNRFSLMEPDDGDTARIRASYRPAGQVNVDFDHPGTFNNLQPGLAIDIMVTMTTDGRFDLASTFLIGTQRNGPYTLSFLTCEVFNFQSGRWEGFQPFVQTDFGDDPVENDVFEPYIPYSSVARLLEPNTGNLYIRLTSTQGGNGDRYIMDYDWVYIPSPPQSSN
ncbi:MAG: hypothetical protein MK077_07580 [Phycisphaerales bacterium]|nr:hypothetical protein [Phycisphaerales bacterium]